MNTTLPEHGLENPLYTLNTRRDDVHYATANDQQQVKNSDETHRVSKPQMNTYEMYPGTNPVYDGSVGDHLALGKSATAAGAPEHELLNPLYSMESETQGYFSSQDQQPQHNYDYASTGPPPQSTSLTAVLPPTNTDNEYDYARLPGKGKDSYNTQDRTTTSEPPSQSDQQPQHDYDYATTDHHPQTTPPVTVTPPTSSPAVYDYASFSGKNDDKYNILDRTTKPHPQPQSHHSPSDQQPQDNEYASTSPPPHTTPLITTTAAVYDYAKLPGKDEGKYNVLDRTIKPDPQPDQPLEQNYDYATTGNLSQTTDPTTTTAAVYDYPRLLGKDEERYNVLDRNTKPHTQTTPPTTTTTTSAVYDYASFPADKENTYDALDRTTKPHTQPHLQPELTYDYAESPSGLGGGPSAVYDAPLLAPKVNLFEAHDYDYADIKESESTNIFSTHRN